MLEEECDICRVQMIWGAADISLEIREGVNNCEGYPSTIYRPSVNDWKS